MKLPVTKLLGCTVLAIVLSTSLHAAISLTAQSLTANSITIKLEGDLSGTTPNQFTQQLYITSPGGGFVTQGTSLANNGNVLSGVNYTASTSGGGGGFLFLNFERSLTTSPADTGTDTFITLSSASSIFNPNFVGDINLSWGSNGGTLGDGAFQSTFNIVPEPGIYASWLGLATLALVFWQRRKAK